MAPKFRWGLLSFLSLLWLWLSPVKIKSTPSPRPKTGVWQKNSDQKGSAWVSFLINWAGEAKKYCFQTNVCFQKDFGFVKNFGFKNIFGSEKVLG